MLPLVIKPDHVDVTVIGDGPATHNRTVLLNECGFSFDINKGFGAGKLALEKLKNDKPQLVYIADFSVEESKELHDLAKAKNALVNVEDKADFCDFNVPARVRRGDLLLTVSTSGASPRVARRLRTMLEQLFPEKWTAVLADIKIKRPQWKASGDSFDEVAVKTDKLLADNGLLETNCACLNAWKEVA